MRAGFIQFIGIALVLSAVFVPTAFIPGITGRLYQQFAVTIAISVLLSAFNALTLSPALAALLLRPKKPSRGLSRRFFDWFNRTFARTTRGYVRWSGVLLQKGQSSLSCLQPLELPLDSLLIACPPASCLMRTRAMVLCTYNSRTGLR